MVDFFLIQGILMQKIDIVEIIISSLKQIISEQDPELPTDHFDKSTQLFGPGSLLDSMAMVSLIVDVEQKLQEKLDMDITIADERAMSMERSPFRTVEALAEYIQLLVEEKSKNV